MMTRMQRTVLTGLLVTFGLLSCGDGPVQPTEGTIGPAGGTLSFLNGLVTVTFPANAVTESTVFTAAAATGAPSSNLLVAGSAVDITPAYDFATPVQVTVKVSGLTLPTGVNASELRLDKAVGGQWQVLDGSAYDAGAGTVTASSSSFSTFGVVGVAAASVDVAPASDTIFVGNNTQLEATVKDGAGTTLPNRTVTWSSNSSSVASVDADGLVTGVASGTATITAMSGTASGSATIQVDTVPNGDPTPWFEEDFSEYTSTADMVSDPRGIYTNEDNHTDRMALDQAVGWGNLTQSMRYDWPDRTSEGTTTGTNGYCGSYYIGRALTPPSSVQEVWGEFYVRFSPGFTTVAPSGWGCGSNPDLKLIFGRTLPDARFQVKVGNGPNQEWGWRWPNGPEYNLPAAQWPSTDVFNGQWIRIRIHWKYSTTTTSADGIYQLWINDQVAADTSGVNSLANNLTDPITAIYGFWLGENMNQGPGQPESMWWGRIRLWNTDPGW